MCSLSIRTHILNRRNILLQKNRKSPALTKNVRRAANRRRQPSEKAAADKEGFPKKNISHAYRIFNKHGFFRTGGVIYRVAVRYSTSLTGSNHSLEVFSPSISTARCANQLSAAAPCQCLTFAGMLITVPGRIITAGFPSS